MNRYEIETMVDKMEQEASKLMKVERAEYHGDDINYYMNKLELAKDEYDEELFKEKLTDKVAELYASIYLSTLEKYDSGNEKVNTFYCDFNEKDARYLSNKYMEGKGMWVLTSYIVSKISYE